MIGVAKLALDNVDSQLKSVRRDRGAHYIMMKRSIHLEDTVIIGIYAPNISSPKCIKQILTELQGGMDSNTIRVGTSIPHSHQRMDHPDRKSIRTQQRGLH